MFEGWRWRILSGLIRSLSSPLRCVCVALLSRCRVWLVLWLLAACASHVIPVDAVVLLGFR